MSCLLTHTHMYTRMHTHPTDTLLELSEFVKGGFDLTPVVSLYGKFGKCLAWPQPLIPHSVEGKPTKLFRDAMKQTNSNSKRAGSMLTNSDSWF